MGLFKSLFGDYSTKELKAITPVVDRIEALADEYRRTTGNDIWVHAIDLQGYGTQQFHGPKTNIIAGWSEKVFNFIKIAEAGEGSLERAIEAYKW